MPVGSIASITNIKPRQVRECLFVMIQHNVAVYAEAQERNRIVTYYEINRLELLHRPMIPKVLRYSREWFEKDGGLIAQAILTHGKLTVEDCLKEILTDTTTARTQAQRKDGTR